nr:heavy metal translocating P-type ATPase [Gordonia rhizosphera]
MVGPRGWSSTWSVTSVRWATTATLLFCCGVVAQLAGGPTGMVWAFYLACYVTGGWEPALEGLRALRGRKLDVDLLMIVAALGAAAIGQIFDGALLIVIFATSGALEDLAIRRTQESVRSLLDDTPDRASLVDRHGEEVVVSAADLRPGDVIVVRPGERIAADGTVVGGTSDVDQSSITGESLPVGKTSGETVFAGTLNGTGAIRVRVDTRPDDTVAARIVAMVAEASATKARSQLFIEKVETVYSSVVVVATVALFAIPLMAGADLQTTLLRAMTFMIVASPCAVVLATMPPLLSAIATAGRHGVLVKSAVAAERLADVTRVALDKTGTVTTGAPAVTDIVVVDPSTTPDAVLTLAAAAELHSEHPVGRALVAAARDRHLRLPSAVDFVALPGRGVRATVAFRRVEIMNASTRTESVVADARRRFDVTGGTSVVVVVDDTVLGVVALHDHVRRGAVAAVSAITEMTGTSPILLTGDNAAAARRIATTVGIGDVRANLLPQDKVDAVRALRDEGTRIAVVGDGINDAPALATADVGVAMGRVGADLTLHTADVVIVGDDLTAVPTLLQLARRARRVVIANLVFAAAVIVTLVTWDLVGHLPLPLGVAGHEGSTILVALNGLRLLGSRAWRRAQRG